MVWRKGGKRGGKGQIHGVSKGSHQAETVFMCGLINYIQSNVADIKRFLFFACKKSLLCSETPWASHKCTDVPVSFSPSPPSSSHVAGRWPGWLSGLAGRSSPPLEFGTWTDPLLCRTSCARNTHGDGKRRAHFDRWFTNMHGWIYVQQCAKPLKSNGHVCKETQCMYKEMHSHPSHQCLKCSAETVDILGCFGVFFHHFLTDFFFPVAAASTSVTHPLAENKQCSLALQHTYLPDSNVNQVESRPYRRSELRGHMTSLRRGLCMSHR